MELEELKALGFSDQAIEAIDANEIAGSFVETAETLENWIESSKKWSERSKRQDFRFDGKPALAWEKVQMRKGDRRDAVSVIDLGDRRLVIDYDLACFSELATDIKVEKSIW
ncbi:MAG: hypothetical protein LBQ52_05410 [Helicobacteraceae bacterium]|nr:hypothetical protein [Helicobacteraceae bacterium]